MKLRKGDLVVVETDDIEHHDFGWEAFATIAERKRQGYLAVGWVISLSRRTLILAPVTAPAEDRAHCAYALPRRAIRKIKRWRP